VSELCAVATSDKRQQQHRQLQWTQLKPSPIAMDAINAIIVRCQSAHKRSPSNAMRKAVAISLEATRRPCQRMQQEHREGVVSITTILILRQQISPQGHQSPQVVHNKRKRNVSPTRAGVKGCRLDTTTDAFGVLPSAQKINMILHCE
jgi:hypothetical protein